MMTFIREIDGRWYAFEMHNYQVYSIGADNPKDGRWVARAVNKGIQYVASPSPSRKAAYAKAKRWGEYGGEY